MKVTVINGRDGLMHVHESGCADIRRELAKANGHFFVEATSRDEVFRDIWSDFLTDDEDEDEETYWANTHFAPCVKLEK